MVRVATYINTMPAAIHMIEDAKEKGYEVTCKHDKKTKYAKNNISKFHVPGSSKSLSNLNRKSQHKNQRDTGDFEKKREIRSVTVKHGTQNRDQDRKNNDFNYHLKNS